MFPQWRLYMKITEFQMFVQTLVKDALETSTPTSTYFFYKVRPAKIIIWAVLFTQVVCYCCKDTR